MSKIQLLISVNEEYKDRLPEVAEKLRSAGMQVDQWLVEIGVITGSAASEKIEQLRQIPGVAAIEAAAEYQIAPPDSDLQ
ncbi:ketohydroxyglutarate aldolase [Leptothermofonsia sichuanensis E412]|uniref:ketohydroxyglutarate aldolase n=1 Tax=Leptothermofonsia sichuanensis TaxID=2917832 RepID=UPI001CA6C0EE|nr:ketohydroxyglutarate aldolase [Leptothermofonsia sichuanensis]QZZ19142.1 ketohydroxyglutarate aldolase [Leptothermofonsia sichuanensis E412]